jgi:8-oxoguanine deaminase
MRFHAARGSMSVGQSQGGLPPDGMVERRGLHPGRHATADRGLARPVAMRDAAHRRRALLAVLSVSPGLMRDAALLARRHGVQLHTHLAENDSDIAYTRERFGCTPAEYAEQLGWLGPDVWHAHCVQARRRRHPGLRAQRHRRGALPGQQHASGLGHRAGACDA